MSKILIPIKPIYAEKILDGTKLYEYRKIVPKKLVDTMIIYETSPVMKIVGEAKIEEIIEDSPQKLWDKTKDYSGISKEFYDKYFNKKDKAYAYKLASVKRYDTPKTLKDIKIDYVPQSFVYIDSND